MGLVRKKAIDLLDYRRFDITAKLIYIDFFLKQLDSEWGLKVYRRHLEVWNNLREHTPNKKEGLGEFLVSLRFILKGIEKDRFNFSKSPVILNQEGALFNGSHRIASAIRFDKEVLCQAENVHKDYLGDLYDYSYFRKLNLEEQYLDAMAIEYCRWKKDTYIATVFPSAQGHEEKIAPILKKYGNIVYYQEVSLYDNGPLNLMRQIYYGEDWIGTYKSNFGGAREKVRLCFGNSENIQSLRVYLIETKKKEKLIDCKNEIRKLFRIGNHSIHINDLYSQTIRISKILFNFNSIHYLNCAKPRDLGKFKNFVKDKDVCLTGSAVLDAYGIRECRDIDYFEPEGKHGHISELKYYKKTIGDIIFNPSNYFYFDDIKFVCLRSLLKMKKNRNEEKDKRDIDLVDRFLDENLHIDL